MINSLRGLRRADHLAQVIDAIGMAMHSTQRAQVRHDPAAVQEGMHLVIGIHGLAYYLTSLVDREAFALEAAKGAQVGHAAVAVDKGMLLEGRREGRTD